jgi:putative Holliday junction resolvase
VRLMALDVGNRRIGVALSDPSRTVARGVQVIERTSQQADINLIGSLVQEYDVERIVIGHPLHLDGRAGDQARRTEDFATKLERELEVPLVLWDEAFSTERARQAMIEAGRKRKERRQRLDAVAAAAILQDYLDRLGRERS